MTITPNEDVMFRRLGERMILIHLQSNEIFDLNETSARMWELLVETGEPDAVEARLAGEFDVDPADLHREVASTLATLAQNGLITGYDPR